MIRFRRLGMVTAATSLALAMLAPAASATWSVVGVDPETGQVGVAAASCVNVEITFLANLLPGVGAGASQAFFNPDAPPEIQQQLKDGATAEEAILAITDPGFDDDASFRQYGVVTLARGAAGFTGSSTTPVALDRRNPAGTASAQGNILVSKAVVREAVAAFDATPGSLADRLLAALEAGGAEGGDSRCGAQTAQAAFLIVVSRRDKPWVPLVHPDPPTGRGAPDVCLSVLEPFGGDNPVEVLRELYDAGARCPAARRNPVR